MRGSIPAPGASTARYGGNTPCVEVRCGDELLIFDLGSGARPLGEAMVRDGTQRASIFVSHYHYDHVQGLPFFPPIFNPRNAFTIYGPTRGGHTVKEILSGQMVRPYFPVGDEVFRAQVEYRTINAGERVGVGAAEIHALELNHPGGNLAYRVEYEGHSLVYATDVEHGSEADIFLIRFARGADMFIVDAMYTDDEYAGRKGPPRNGWGHQTWKAAVSSANRAEVKKLVLFHHEPTRSDADLERMMREIRKLRPDAVAARESLELWA
ncbi:MAG TPA: MBL fold metallo-hydrolase [Myxococcaceae bacterium]|nr:MBL fold metallo-hydrolase [Myxococcaceae bacterium]